MVGGRSVLLVEHEAWGGCCVLHGAGYVHALLCLVYAVLHGVCSLREGSCQALRRVGSRPLLLARRLLIR